ncbi:MAG: ribosome maturation factor RimP [Spirulina sp. SIO3F2]|nr:ribosome maturation factor RimP [Spirulina sp. SIO3F2]
MAHPIIPQLLALATPIAQALGLEVVDAVFQTSKSPPVLRIDIRNLQADTGLQDCEQMSRALEEPLEASGLLEGAYVLEISSPGTARQLTHDREFVAFKGFAVLVKTYAPHNGKKEWQGNLQGRDDQNIYLAQKGKAIAIPRQLVANVHLDDAS